MACLADAPYDVVVFLLDDMRMDQLPTFTETNARIASESVNFTRAYATTPMCAPSRASLLSGGWLPQETGVLTNETPYGGASVFLDSDTLATRLQEAGYTTALFGKYLNDYDALGPYVPPGWTVWAATSDAGGWTDFDVNTGSSDSSGPATASAAHVSGYVTDWQGDAATALLSRVTDTPVFVYLPFLAPHHPHTPAPEDADEFPDYTYRDRAYEEEDVSDKPAWIQATPLMSADEQASADEANRERLQTLLSVDRAMAGIIAAVQASPRADRTVFVITSDNGQMWREHRLAGKGVGYEESALVPLLIASPGLTARSTDTLVAMNLDLPATIQALAGVPIEGDGTSLVPTLCSGSGTGRDDVVLQDWEGDIPAWSGLATAGEKYLETAGGERELYDLVSDPYEERSLDQDSDAQDEIAALSDTLASERGLVISTTELPDATVDEAYDTSIEHWGGEGAMSWELADGALPPGLTLAMDGTMSGTPTASGRYSFVARVTDSGSSPVTGAPQVWSAPLAIVVNDGDLKLVPTCGCGTSRGSPGVSILTVLLALLRRRRAQPIP